MKAFNYEDILMSISFWGFAALTVAFCIMAIVAGSGNKSKPHYVAWGIFGIASLILLPMFIVQTGAREAATVAYKEQAIEHIKTVGKFDTVKGTLGLNPETPSKFDVSFGKVTGECFTRYPEDKNGEIEFRCGTQFVPLEEAHKALQAEWDALNKKK